jgi:photosystem II stability/assembly factor-like uncharacterized protein
MNVNASSILALQSYFYIRNTVSFGFLVHITSNTFLQTLFLMKSLSKQTTTINITISIFKRKDMKNLYILASLFCMIFLLQVLSLQAQWVQTNGPYGGNITSFTTINSTLYAGTKYGVFRSNDNGASWTEVNRNLSATTIRILAVNGTTLFAVTDTGSVLRSTDTGITWTKVEIGQLNPNVLSLVTKGSTLFAGTSNGVFRSSDNGEYWTEVNVGLGNIGITSLLVHGTSILAGTGYSGIFRSIDNGESWIEISTGIKMQPVRALWANDSMLIAGTDSREVFRSRDNGLHWSKVDSNLSVLCFEAREKKAFRRDNRRLVLQCR